jgi:hypothetical protein
MSTSVDQHKIEDYRSKIMQLEEFMLEEFESVELQINHYFANGTYTRELIIPAGVLLTGHIHRHSCINILTKGRIQIVTDEGVKELTAPYVAVTGDGVKKAGYALEDSIWINVFPWNGTDTVEQIEQKVIIPSYEALDNEKREALCQS